MDKWGKVKGFLSMMAKRPIVQGHEKREVKFGEVQLKWSDVKCNKVKWMEASRCDLNVI